MEDSVRKKLSEIYYELAPTNVLDVFIEQFTEENVDSDIPTFEKFLDSLKDLTPGRLGITKFSDSNDFGSYTVNAEDYEKNGRCKPLIEYVPDLGILDYLKPRLHMLILNGKTSFSITVHFPKVRVTNEYDKFVDIQDLWAWVIVNVDGKLTEAMKLTRSTFPYSHFKAHYAHSHLPHVYKNEIGGWRHPCLGHGPLNDTQSTLARRYDKNIWGLFTFELAQYVTVESISGGPYVRLESIGKGDLAGGLGCFRLDNTTCIGNRGDFLGKMLMRFIKYYASQNKISVKYVDGEYQFGENPVDACIHLSSAFITWYNRRAFGSATPADLHDILKPYIIADGKIYCKHTNDGCSVQDALDINGRRLFDFKGQPVTLKIIVENELVDNDNTYMLFPGWLLDQIVSYILGIMNFKHSKSNGERRQNSQTTQIEPSKKFLIV